MNDVLIYQREDGLTGEENSYANLVILSDWKKIYGCLKNRTFCLILIHLEKKDRAGMELASRIREIPEYYFIPIIFLAWDDEYREEAFYSIHCYDYLIRPITTKDMVRIMDPFIHQMYLEQEHRQVTFKIRGNRYVVNMDDILYMQCGNREVEIVTKKGALRVPYLNLKEFLCKYPDCMIRCHRSAAFNRRYLKKLNFRDRVIELWGAKVDMGREYTKPLREIFKGDVWM